MDKLQTYELVIDEQSNDEVFAISLVDEPAIETDFMFFNAVEQTQQEFEFSTIDEERRIVAGAVLIPNMEILRKSEDGYYNVFFSEQTVEQLAHQFVKNKRSDNVTLQHAMMANGISLIESWVIADPDKDKSQTFGFSLPKGTWFSIFKVDNDEVWEKFVKTGKLRGFSVEVKISKVKQQLKKENSMTEETKVEKTETISSEDKSRLTTLLERVESIFSKKEKMEDAEKKEEMKDEDKKEKMEDVTEEMVTVELPEPMRGEIFIPEDLEDEKVELEAHDKTYIIHVYVKEMEPVEQADTDQEPANPQEVVVDEFNAIKAELAELKKFVNESQTAETFTKTAEGSVPATDGEMDVQEIMAFAKKGMKR